MENNELRSVLEGHLDTLKRNLAVVSLEELKTKYKKPFEELQQNIRTTATAYVKCVTLGDLRIRSDFLGEAQPLIQSTIDESGLMRQISAAAFKRQDISEIDQLVTDLKERISQVLIPFYGRHLRLCLDQECLGSPPKAPKFYNEATGCIWRDGAWAPAEIGPKDILLPLGDMPKTAA